MGNMFLSKKWIIIVVSVTGLAFLTLLVIQYGWVRTSFEVNRRHFNDRMMLVSNRIREAFLCDSSMQPALPLRNREHGGPFQGRSSSRQFETTIRSKLDSVLKARKMPAATDLYATDGHDLLPDEYHSN